jgi:hypothetical protein
MLAFFHPSNKRRCISKLTIIMKLFAAVSLITFLSSLVFSAASAEYVD